MLNSIHIRGHQITHNPETDRITLRYPDNSAAYEIKRQHLAMIVTSGAITREAYHIESHLIRFNKNTDRLSLKTYGRKYYLSRQELITILALTESSRESPSPSPLETPPPTPPEYVPAGPQQHQSPVTSGTPGSRAEA